MSGLLRRFRRRKRYDFAPPRAAAVPEATQVKATIARLRRPASDDPLYAHFQRNDRHNLHKWHHYFEIYNRFLARLRDRSHLRLLEIGVFRGGSLDLWRGYFHRDATIVGIDIDASCKAFGHPERNIWVEVGDQSDAGFLKGVAAKYGPFDVIIDDGGHMTSQQIASFSALYPEALTDDGVYLVEDLHTNYWRGFRDTKRSFVDLAKSLVDRLHEPYFGHESELFFRAGDEKQLATLEVTRFCADTLAVSFFDSVIVFEKRRRSLPLSEIR
jgi:hypothetical protein